MSNAQAQITITEGDILALLSTTQTITDFELAPSANLNAIAAASGANQTWDFSGETTTETFVFTETYLGDTSGLPGSEKPEFADADFALTLDVDSANIYIYYSLMDGEWRTLGTTFVGDADGDGTDEEFSTFFSPPSLELDLPLEFGKTWEDSTSIVLEGVPLVTTEESTYSVDGWGTVITPDGSFDALRLMVSTSATTAGFPSGTSTFISFISVSGGVAASILLSTTGEVESASYSTFGERTATAAEGFDEVPSTFELGQNYPNPFNPSTRIAYSLPSTSDVRLTVYSLIGQEVATLVNTTQGPGTYEVTFDASELSSGVYLYKLQTEGFTQTRVMSLIK